MTNLAAAARQVLQDDPDSPTASAYLTIGSAIPDDDPLSRQERTAILRIDGAAEQAEAELDGVGAAIAAYLEARAVDALQPQRDCADVILHDDLERLATRLELFASELRKSMPELDSIARQRRALLHQDGGPDGLPRPPSGGASEDPQPEDSGDDPCPF